MKYSVITASYNSYKYMERYFDSLEKQTYKDFEIIIVDDCSTDGTLEKIINYSKTSRLDIKILRTERNSGGPAVGRNLALEEAQGEWVTFLDADDWVDEKLFQTVDAIEEDVNCIIFDYYTNIDGINIARKSIYSERRESCKIRPEEYIAFGINAPWGKFYKKIILQSSKVRFPDLKRCDDVVFTCQAIDVCDSAYYVMKPMYYNRQRRGSLSRDNSHGIYMNIAFNTLNKTLGDKYPEALYEKSVRDYLYGGLLMKCKAGESKNQINKFIQEYENIYPLWNTMKTMEKIEVPKRLFLYCAKQRYILALRFLSEIHTVLTSI